MCFLPTTARTILSRDQRSSKLPSKMRGYRIDGVESIPWLVCRVDQHRSNMANLKEHRRSVHRPSPFPPTRPPPFLASAPQCRCAGEGRRDSVAPGGCHGGRHLGLPVREEVGRRSCIGFATAWVLRRNEYGRRKGDTVGCKKITPRDTCL